jgi:glycosyltransferase involved in cell wall biosynthesis
MIDLSVIICTHNPRPHYLPRVLDALRAQTLPLEQWELLLVDNASSEPLASRVDLSWHPLASHVHEPALGLTPARLRGIDLARASVLVFVDDDNVLQREYLARARDITAKNPQLGAWGGNIRPEFETPPPEWTRPYWKFLANREVPQDRIARSLAYDPATTPFGAGMCVRREVAKRYAEQLSKSTVRQSLDRKGQSLASAGDIDLALTACEMGMDAGVFARLELTHLIPPERLTEDYLLRLCKSLAMSSLLLRLIRGIPVRRLPCGVKWWSKVAYDCVRKWSRNRRFYLANALGQRAAWKMFARLRAASEDRSNSAQKVQDTEV